MNLFLFLAAIFLFTLVFGRAIEKIRIPWIFAALFIGLILSFNNPFPEITSSDTFQFLAEMGMYFLLFIIGFDLQIAKILQQKKFIATLSTALIISETLIGTLIIHYVFGIDWPISLLVASSFSTVGEAVLVPILDEFKLMNTNFGQAILGVGTFDDIIEIATVMIVSIMLGVGIGVSQTSILSAFSVFGVIFLIPAALLMLGNKVHRFSFKQTPSILLFSFFIIFLFVGTGSFVEAASLGALLSGISLKTLLGDSQREKVEDMIRNIAFGFFVPIFFISIGVEVDIHYLFTAPLLVLLIVFSTKLTKILSSILIARKKFGMQKSILMGIGLSAKFSTSIVIISLLYSENIIPIDLYSVLIGAMIVSKFIIPVLFSVLIQKWELSFKESKHPSAE